MLISSPQIMVKKRNGGRMVIFDATKIQNAIYRAMCDVKKGGDKQLAVKLTEQVVKEFPVDVKIISIELIQDIVERVLMKELPDVAKQYILYRDEKKKLRASLASTLNIPVEELDDISKKNLTVNSAGVFAARYLIRDLETNKIKETMSQLWDRIAKHIALVDVMYNEYIFSKTITYNHKTIDFDSLVSIYKTYTEEERNPRLNLTYLEHVYRRFAQIKNNIAITFDEFFFAMFTNLEKNTVKNDIIALGYSVEELIDIQDTLTNVFEKSVYMYKEMMSSFRFLPNTPTLMNAGTKNGQLCACFTLDIEDDIRSIFSTVGDTAVIFQGAGGVGINFSKLRPLGDSVDNVPNAATGPISFQSIINYITDIIKQGGKRKGANMGILETWHPDIEKWITMKTIPGVMENYNISVGIDKNFWNCFDKNTDYSLINPRNQKIVKSIPSHQLFSMIADSAWKCAEPGIIYLDNVNKYNPLQPILGQIKITNPCAEQAMYKNNSCTLGSINLAKYVHNHKFDYELFREDVFIATQFLDNVLDINNYPTPEIQQESLKIRRIGLGFMGLAHALFKMNIPYNSKEGFEFTEKIATLLTLYSMQASVCLAVERGAHGYWNKIHAEDVFEETFNGYTQAQLVDLFTEKELLEYIPLVKKHGIRNTWTTTIAPTGTISMAADTSNGIEPVYALVFVKQTSVGRFYYVDRYFEQKLKEEGLYSEELLEKIAANHGSCKGLVPSYISDIFVTSVDIHWLDHLYALAVAQKGIANSISKTVNLPKYVTPEDFKLAYLLARYFGIKGLALYRDGSRESQVMDTTSLAKVKENQYKNPFDKHLTKIGEKAVEKTAVIETKPSKEALSVVMSDIIPKMNKDVAAFVTEIMSKNLNISMEKSKINTEEKCPLCSAGMIDNGHCITCSECQYGYCA